VNCQSEAQNGDFQTQLSGVLTTPKLEVDMARNFLRV